MPLELGKRFVVDETSSLGRGFFGVVFKGFDKRKNETIAVKRISRSNSTGFDEIKSLKHISDNKHAVHLLDYFFHDKTFYIVMEFCDAGNLEEFILKTRPGLRRIMQIMKQCASALQYLHGLDPKVVHRDIKLDNFLCKKIVEKKKIVIKLTDFGLARVTEMDRMLATQVGCRPYIAPEVSQGKSYDEKVDIFALGLVFVVLINMKPNDAELSPLCCSGVYICLHFPI